MNGWLDDLLMGGWVDKTSEWLDGRRMWMDGEKDKWINLFQFILGKWGNRRRRKRKRKRKKRRKGGWCRN